MIRGRGLKRHRQVGDPPAGQNLAHTPPWDKALAGGPSHPTPPACYAPAASQQLGHTLCGSTTPPYTAAACSGTCTKAGLRPLMIKHACMSARQRGSRRGRHTAKTDSRHRPHCTMPGWWAAAAAVLCRCSRAVNKTDVPLGCTHKFGGTHKRTPPPHPCACGQDTPGPLHTLAVPKECQRSAWWVTRVPHQSP